MKVYIILPRVLTMINLNLLKKTNFKDYLLIEGFPGYGLVGTIAVNYLVEKLDMQLVGYFESHLFPPIAAIHDGMPLPPMRMYVSKKHKIVVVLAEFVMSNKTIHHVADFLYEWAAKNKIKKIVSLGGIAIKGQQDEVFAIVSDPREIKSLEKIGIESINEGATTGINAILLTKASMSKKVPVISLLAEAKANYVDPLGAAMVLTSLADYTDIQIDASELVKEAMIIEAKLKQSMEAAEKAEKIHGKHSDYGSMYV